MIDLSNNSFSENENQNPEPDQRFTFWTAQGKIIPGKLYEFFESCNIGLYFSGENEGKNQLPVVVQETGNLVSEVNETYLQQIAKSYIYDVAMPLQVLPILDSLHRNVRYFGKKNQYFLPILKLNFIRDTKSSAYLFFKNGIVEITADDIQIKPYGEIEGCVWEKNIVPRKFTPIPYSDLAENFNFLHFLQDITKVEDEGASQNRFNSLFSIIGYLCHRYKDPAKIKAIILMDASPSESGNGRTGKTLICLAIGHVRTSSKIEGKDFDHKRWFKYSSVGLGTNVLLFDDVKKNFDFENLYSLITTGMTVQRIGKDDVYLSFEDSPKIVLTTNYTIKGEGSSFRGRIFEFEISNTFNDEYRPIDKYGKRFFDDWDEDEWNQFYNLIAYAIQFHLKNEDLVESEQINLNRSKLITETNEDFYEFAKDNIVMGVKYDKNVLFNKFKKAYVDYGMLTQKTFTFWLKKLGVFLGAKIDESRSDSVRFIIFTENPRS